MKRLLGSIIFGVTLFFSLAKSSFAVDAVPPPSSWLGGVNLPDKYANLMKPRNWADVGTTLVPAIFTMIFFVGILAFIFLIIRAGLMFILAEGNKENLVKARMALVNVVIGFALLFSVFIIFNVVQLILGVNLTGNLFFGGCYWGGTCPVPPGGVGP